MATRIPVSELIGTVREIGLNDLEAYVSANGIYTPLVKQINIEVNSPLLNGIGLVDTPGLYDVNTDRSKMTDDYIKSLDVVLFFSPTTQFFSETELEHLMKVKDKGISTIIIVASKFDHAFTGRPKGNFLVDCANYKSVVEQAKNNLISQFKQQRYKNDLSLLTTLNEIEQCEIFIYSSYFDKYARNLELSEGEKFAIGIIKEKYKDLTPELVKSVINGDTFFTDFVEKCKVQKRKILQDNLYAFEKSIFSSLITSFRELIEKSGEKIRFITDNDISKIEAAKKNISTFLANNKSLIEKGIDDAFNKCIKSVTKDVEEFIDKFDKSLYEKIKESHETKRIRVSREYFLWWEWNVVYSTYTETTGNIPETKKQISKLAQDVNGVVGKLLTKDSQQKHVTILKGEIVSVFQNAPQSVIGILNYVLKQIVEGVKFNEFKGIEKVDLSPINALPIPQYSTPEKFKDTTTLQNIAKRVVNSYFITEKQAIADYTMTWEKEMREAQSLFKKEFEGMILKELSNFVEKLKDKNEVISKENEFITMTENYIAMCKH